jgi:sec-independent protein translocase protein TatA
MIGVSHWELLIVALVVLILFGHRLPKVMGSMGEAVRSFRDGLAGDDRSRSGDSSIYS